MSKTIRLKLNDLQVKTHIGVTDDERNITQSLLFDIELSSNKMPDVVSDDESEDYVCYASLSEKICDYCQSRKFRTIEFLAKQIFDIVKANIPSIYNVEVMVKKLSPQMKSSLKYASFVVSDE